MRKRALPVVEFSVCEGGQELKTVCGREAETLIMLVSSGARGVTAYDFRGGPPFRLSAYICDLRKQDVSILTEREDHDCGSHARYVLSAPVRVHSIRRERVVEAVS